MLALLATPRLRYNLSLLLLPAVLAAPAAVRAADLGPILLTSPAGQPLQGLVSLSLGADESPDDLGVAVGTAAEYGWLEIGRPSWVDDVQVHVTKDEDEARVRLWTTEAPPDRRFSLLLVVSSPAGRSLRQYDVVLRDAEVLLAPAEPQGSAGGDVAVRPPGEAVGADASASDEGGVPGARPPRRVVRIPTRANAEQRRNLSISSAGTRLPVSALEKRAQRLEEDAAAQRRALTEANSRISDLQGQVENLEKLLALKAGPPAVEKSAGAAAGAAAEPPPKPVTGAERPAEPAPPAAAASPPAAAPAAAAPAPASAAAPMVDVDPASATDAAGEPTAPPADAASETPVSGSKDGQADGSSEQDEGVAGMLMVVGGVVVALVLATLGTFWWRRRRSRQGQQHAVDDAVVPEPGPLEDAPATIETAAAAQAAVADAMPEAGAQPVAQAVAIEAVDASINAALDAPLGNLDSAESAPNPDVAVATLEAVTAEPSQTAGVDDLEALFSEEAIAAAQAAIRATAVVEPSPAAEAVAEVALESEAPPSANEIPASSAGEPASAGTVEDEAAGEGDNEADLEDVEVNLAKAYIDMGDPDGARAILEGMLSDPDNPDRADLARRTMRRFGLRPSAPSAESAAAGG